MLRFEYDEVVAFHPYRTYQPWDHGGRLLLQVDGVNIMSEAERRDVADRIRLVERELIQRAHEADIDAGADNHYGFTVRVGAEGSARGPDGFWSRGVPTFYQVRFSDGSLYLWLMPGPPP